MKLGRFIKITCLALLLCICLFSSIQLDLLTFKVNLNQNNNLKNPETEDKNELKQESTLSTPSYSVQPFQTPKILFIVGNETAPDPISDVPFYDYMTTTLGYDVTYEDDDTDQIEYEFYDALILSYSITNKSNIGSLRNISVPILIMAASLYDEYQLGTGYSNVTRLDFKMSDTVHYISDGITSANIDLYSVDKLVSFLMGYKSVPDYLDVIELAKPFPSGSDYRSLIAVEKGGKDWSNNSVIERRAYWGATTGNQLLTAGFSVWNKTLSWLLYNDKPGSATIQVEVNDKEDLPIENANVTLTDSFNSSHTFRAKTAVDGLATFSNIAFGYYNLSVAFEGTKNNSLTFLEISGERTYDISPSLNYQMTLPIYLDDIPPLIENIHYINKTQSFWANVSDTSTISFVYLNITVINSTDFSTEIALQNISMVPAGGTAYYNDTILDSLTNNDVIIYFNIIARDSLNNSIASPINEVNLGDLDDPVLQVLNVIDYGNGTLQYYANITDETSKIESPVVLYINSSLHNMYKDATGYWVYRTTTTVGFTYNYTLDYASDTTGNEIGLRIDPTTATFHIITAKDTQAPHIYGLSDTIASHDYGSVEFICNVDDWTEYQSGLNTSSVSIRLEINQTIIEIYKMQQLEIDYFYFEFEFNLFDNVSYWILAEDLAGNTYITQQYGPYTIIDNVLPQTTYEAMEYGNGTVTFQATVTDFPNNDTIAFIHYSQNIDGTWENQTMKKINSTAFVILKSGFNYGLLDVWYYVSASDSYNNTYIPTEDQYKRIRLTDNIKPVFNIELYNSTIEDCQITIQAQATDPFGDSFYLDAAYYINITYQGTTTHYNMSRVSVGNYVFSGVYQYNEIVSILVWTYDSAGNLGIYQKTIQVLDYAPPDINSCGLEEYQNGTIKLWLNVTESQYGSGIDVYAPNVYVQYIFIAVHLQEMKLSKSGIFIATFTGFKPGDTIVYNFSVQDRAGNIASTSLQSFTIQDKTAPIYDKDNSGYQKVQTTTYNTRLEFFVSTYDPFGSVETVSLSIYNFNTSSWYLKSEKMNFNGSYYVYQTDMLCDKVFNYSIAVSDNWNQISKTFGPYRTFDCLGLSIDDIGSEKAGADQTLGTRTFYITLDDTFIVNLTVYFTIFDVSNSRFLLNNETLEGERITSQVVKYEYSYIVSYESRIQYIFTLVDAGVIQNYYNASTFMKEETIGDDWEPIIKDTGFQDFNNGTLLFWADIDDWGSGISNVTLEYPSSVYEVSSGNNDNLKIYQTNSPRKTMIHNGSFYVTTITIQKSYNLRQEEWKVIVVDEAGNVNSDLILKESYFVDLPAAVSNGIDIFSILTLMALPVTIFSGVLGVYYLYTQYKKQVEEQKRSILSRYMDTVNFKAIIAFNEHGMSFYTRSLISSGDKTELLAGVTSALSQVITEVSKEKFSEGDIEILQRGTYSIMSHRGKYSVVSFISGKAASPYLEEKLISFHQMMEYNISKEKMHNVLHMGTLKGHIDKILCNVFPFNPFIPLKVNLELLKEKRESLESKFDETFISNVSEIPSFKEYGIVFHIDTFISTFTSRGKSLADVFSFLETLNQLNIVKSVEDCGNY